MLPKVKVKIAVGIEHIKQDGSQRRRAACRRRRRTNTIVVGAHYDHLGLGSGNSSLARAGEEEKIHPGADDNASGTAAVMELAASLARGARASRKLKRGIIFALWSGEEIGLIGSRGLRREAAGADLEKIVGLHQLRHGRPAAGQQAHAARRRLVEGSGGGCSRSATSPRASTSRCRRTRICRPTSRASIRSASRC